MPERLYNRYSACTELGNEICDKVATFINVLADEYPDVDLNDLNGVVNSTIDVELAVRKLIFATKLRKSNRNEI